MPWLPPASYLIAGAVLTNAVPHTVSGLTGRRFQSPLAAPHGEGLSSATVNVLWGFANLAVGYLLVAQVGDFDPRNIGHVAALGLGIVLIGLPLARHFGRCHGGNLPERS